MNVSELNSMQIHRAMRLLRPSWILWILAGVCFIPSQLQLGRSLAESRSLTRLHLLLIDMGPALLTLGWLLVISAVLIAVQRLVFNFRLGPLYDEIDRLRTERRENASQIGGLKSKVDYAQLNLKTRTDQLDEAHATIRRLKLRVRNVKPKKRRGT